MAVPTKWYDWWTTAFNGDANWNSLGYYFDNIQFTCYWLETNQCDWRMNTVVCLYVIKRKIDEIIANGGVTMDAIINAMMGASFTELQKFIGIEDAYRCALWDAPFNEDFYAALARGFKKW